MTFAAARKIDELGRIALPAGLRRNLNWGEGDEVEICSIGNAIIIMLSETSPEVACIFCNKHEQHIRFRGRDICQSCMEAINSHK